MVKISENLGIRIDLELEDSKVKSDLNKIIKNLEDLTKSKAINLKIDIDGNAIKDLEKIEKAVKEINKLSSSQKNALFSNSAEEQKRVTNELKTQQAERLAMTRAQAEAEKTMAKAIANEQTAINKAVLQEQLNQQKANIKAEEQMRQASLKENQMRLQAQLKEESQLRQSQAKEESARLKQQEAEYKQLSDTIAKSMNGAFKNIQKLDMSGFIDRGEIDRIKAEFDSVFQSVNWDNLDRANFDRSIGEIRRLEGEIDKLFEARDRNKREGDINLFSDKMFSQLDRMKSEFRDFGDLGSEFNRIESAIRGLDDVAPDRLPQAMRQIRQEVSQLNGDLRQLNTTTGGGGFFGDLFDSMRTFTLGNMIGNAMEDGVRAIKKVVMDLDSAMTDMMKVAPESFKGTAQELKDVGRTANEIAKGVGKSTEDVIQGTAKALQTGAKTMSDAMEIARSSAMFANVGDLQQEQADTYIASIMSAYGGMENALKPVQKRVKGMSEDYNTLTKFMDLANYSGHSNGFRTNCLESGSPIVVIL